MKLAPYHLRQKADPTDPHSFPARNNVGHVGHSHPRVVEAVAAQAAAINTNTRYLHPNVVALAERLLERCPAPLARVFFVNSGSEANDLALRLARASTGKRDVVCVDHAYHGHTAEVPRAGPLTWSPLFVVVVKLLMLLLLLPRVHRTRHLFLLLGCLHNVTTQGDQDIALQVQPRGWVRSGALGARGERA